MPASSERAVRFYSRQGRSAKTLVRACPKTPERKNYESEDNTMRKSDFTLPTLDDLFSTQAERDDAKLERVRNIPLAELHPFKGHPFKVQNNEEMQRMIESIRKVGAITPALARPLPDDGYELISGHRRLAACQVLGVETMPVIVRELSDDEAVIAMVDANLQRETILPSEKAFAYKMKRDALNH